MNLPTWDKTVTLIQRVESTDDDGKTAVSFKQYTLNKCFWKAGDSISFSGTNAFKDESITCRIPTGNRAPNKGDVLLLGTGFTTPASASELNALIDSNYGKAFRVMNAYDNSGQKIPHYLAKG